MRPLSSLLPLGVLAVSLVVTAGLWRHERQSDERNLRATFDYSLRHTASRIEQRMASYEQMLRGTQGLFMASSRVKREEFDHYVDALLAGADFAGLQAIAYVPLPDGGRDAPAAIGLVAPASAANLAALGGDPAADLASHMAMLQAADSGSLGITSRRVMTGDATHEPEYGFAMFLPLYAGGQAVDSIAARRANLTGWVLAWVRMSDLMSSLYGENTPGIEVRIHDGVKVSEDSLMYPPAPKVPAMPSEPPLFEAQEFIGFAGHTWTLDVLTRPEFAQHHRYDAARIIAISGVGLSLLLALLTHQLATGRRRAHEAARAMTRELRDSEARYRRIVETADEGIWMTDAQSRTSFVNPKLLEMLGYGAEEMLGRPLADFVAEGEAGFELAGDVRGLRLRRKDGSEAWVTLSTRAIVDASGNSGGQLAMVTDVTRQRLAEASRTELEAQLRESQKMEAIGTLAGGIAHDFNNILAAILGNASLAEEHLGPRHPARESLLHINQAAVRARSLVQQILAFSRRQPHQLTAQPLRPLIEESVRLLRSILPAMVALEVRLEDRPLRVAADGTQLQQVVMNLCTNAWHALGGRAGRIELGLDSVDLDAEAAQRLGGISAGRFAHLWVGDDGSGMDEATRRHVFEPFFTTKPVGQGTGLGLSVVHGIVATHRGAIAVRSSPGQGTHFDLYFPLQAETANAAAAIEPAAAAQRETNGQHVLYVDDDPIMLLTVQGLLQRRGYRVSCIEDPREALAALNDQPQAFDLVVTDFNMPVLSGIDVARDIARLRPDLPVVMTSGYFTDEVRAAALQAGVRSLLQKEYTLEQLGGLVQRILAEGAPV